MSIIYAVGVIGEAGIVVSGAGGRCFEQIENGEFTSKRAALAAAAEVAKAAAISADGEPVSMSVTRETAADAYPRVIATATAKAGARRVSWS